jgi:4-hydroxy 2-oxovalerate aldolase
MNDLKILDCTFRDGGYYTDWDFSEEIFSTYISSMVELPVEYIEVGYRNLPVEKYMGEYFYTPIYILDKIRKLGYHKKISLMLDIKNVDMNDLNQLLDPCRGKAELIRMAVAPQDFQKALKISKEIKNKGFKIGLNLMYVSKWVNDNDFISGFKTAEGVVDYLYLVDSYGSIMPEDLARVITKIKSIINIPLGFHGHNNIELAFVNSLVAIKNGCSFIDATVTGMGRGAGNLKTELLLTYLSSINAVMFSFSHLSNVVGVFTDLQKSYNWGTNLPYMISGANSLPQKDVMDWIGKNRYPLETIIHALQNQKEKINDNLKLPSFRPNVTYKKALIIGGGSSVPENWFALRELLENWEDFCIIHSSARNATSFLEIDKDQYYCLVGNEGYRLIKNFKNIDMFKGTCVLPPYPRKMGTFVPEQIKKNAKELSKIDFIDKYEDSPLVLAIQSSKDLGVEEIYFIGFDGYMSLENSLQYELSVENQEIIDELLRTDFYKKIEFLTPTRYKRIPQGSIFAYLK